MSTLLAMLPLYLLGNFHCIGMCGPLVMMIGHHRYRWFYYLGRTLSFTLAGGLAGGLGAVLDLFLRQYHLGAVVSFIFGTALILIGLSYLIGIKLPSFKFGSNLSLLMLKDQALPTFLFGFFTVFLPCGQTLVVFSACALSGSAAVGLLNGFAFALLTTPSLFIAMHAHSLFSGAKQYYNQVLGVFSLLIGLFAICRGFADLGVIPHLVLSQEWHIVIF